MKWRAVAGSGIENGDGVGGVGDRHRERLVMVIVMPVVELERWDDEIQAGGMLFCLIGNEYRYDYTKV